MLERKKLVRVLAGTTVVALAFPLAVIGKAGPKLGSVEFSTPLTVQEAMDIMKKNKVQPTMIQHEFTMDGESAAGGIQAIPGESAADAEKRLKEGFKNFVGFRSSLTPSAEVTPEIQASQKKQIESFKAMNKNLPDIKIKKIEGLSDDFSSIKSSEKVKNVDVKEEPSVGSRIQSFIFPPAAKTYAAPDNELWMPEYNKIYMNAFSDGSRYLDQELSWDQVGWGWWSTFEPDFFTYNYNADGNYYDIRESYSMPVNKYWASNLPFAYLDTRFDDSTTNNPKGQRNEVAYTIGSGYAGGIKANTNYYTYIETVKGTKYLDKGKATGQYGYRNPSNCYSTWCSFGEISVWYKNTPSWSLSIPGTRAIGY